MNKRRFAMRVTKELLASALGLPEGASITGVHQDSGDFFSDSVSLMVHGIGPKCVEGSYAPYMSLDEAIELQRKESDQ